MKPQTKIERLYPRSLKLKNRWLIIFVDGLDSPEDLGLCCPNSHTIQIKRGLSAALTYEVLVHEIQHAMEFDYGINIYHPTIKRIERCLLKPVKKYLKD